MAAEEHEADSWLIFSTMFKIKSIKKEEKVIIIIINIKIIDIIIHGKGSALTEEKETTWYNTSNL